MEEGLTPEKRAMLVENARRASHQQFAQSVDVQVAGIAILRGLLALLSFVPLAASFLPHTQNGDAPVLLRWFGGILLAMLLALIWLQEATEY